MEDCAKLMGAYEELWDFALGQDADGPPPRGLAVFLRQGMPGWMGMWSRLEPPAPLEAAPPPEGTWGRVGGSLTYQVALLLASMALAGGR